MLPSVLTEQLQQGVEDFLRTTFPTTTPHFHGMLGRFFEREGSVFKGPYVNVDLPFRHSGHGPEYFPEVPLGFPPYAHQARAFERLSGDERQSTLVATGTGSGKTEAFLWPVLDYVRQHKGEDGIKAILIYPMNALANDQAGRIAEAVDSIDALEGVRAGLYVGDREEDPTVNLGPEHVITSRETQRLSPPDVLLTNYKMLDYLLTRPSDAKLWRYNEPETLRYLVVDELHTFDGAQGTDLACLIRRLKDRLDTPEGHLCCVGTSATLGGAEDFEELRSYAEDVFGEPFEEGAVIGEQRTEAESFLRSAQHEEVPGPGDHEALDPEAYETPADYIQGQVPFWLREANVSEPTSDAGRLQLGKALRAHSFLQDLLDLLDGPRSMGALAEKLPERVPALQGTSEAHRWALLQSFLSLLSWARSPVEPEGGEMELGPLVQLRSQLWLRELRRMVASIEEDPELLFWDDLPDTSSRDPHLPLAHCLECGAMGWVGIHRQNERQFRDDLKGIYRRYFNDEPTFSFAFPIGPTEDIAAEGSRHQLCGYDLHLSDPEADACEACGREDRLVPVLRPHNRKTTKEGKQIGSNDCPFCGTRRGLTIVGSRAASLTSVLISQLFASAHNEDKSLLTFSDSVQDAAHRAGFFGARTYRFNLRGAIQQFVEQAEGPMPLHALQDAVAEHYLSAMGEKRFVSTFIAPDMEWFREYEALQDRGRIPDDTTLVDDVRRRLKWEVWSEYGFRARIGRTLEKTGSSVASPDPKRLESATDALLPPLQNKVGDLRDVTREEVQGFLRGIAEHLKTQGAVFHRELSTYVKHGGNDYVLNRRPHLPGYGQSSRLPAFISERSTNRFDPILGSSRKGRSWLEAWAIKCLGHRDDMLEGSLDALYHHTLRVLAQAEVLETRSTRKGHRVWGLRPDALRVGSEVAQLRCRECGHNLSTSQEATGDWVGTPCLRYSCTGQYETESASRNYYRRLYRRGDLRRIVAREHTGLLGRDQREALERDFQRQAEPWDPNLLSCTPTLELGVDVGQLSSVILCSVPPAPSNFVQRIGRGGRQSGNAIDVTVANGRPHDLYFFEDPTEMIAGDIEPPGVFLGAVEVLLRQFVAYCFDRWIDSGAGEGAVPSALSRLLNGYGDENVFPGPWLAFVEGHRDELFEDFVDLFGEVLSADRAEALRREIESEGGIGTRVREELGEIKTRREDLHRRSRRLYRRIRDLEDGPVSEAQEEEIEGLRREKTALQEIYQRIGQKNTYNFFTDAGLLPNYAFPESGVTLRSILYRNPDDGAQEVWDEEFVRPAPQALRDLAPGATFYADGRAVQVDQIDLSGDEVLERWRFCDRCAHMQRVVEEEASQAACPNCGSPTWSDQGQERTLVRHDEVQATTADRKSRIDDSSDGREREFFEMAFQARFKEQDVERAYHLDSEDLPFGFEFVREATFREINFGRPQERALLEVCGQEVNGQGFRTCRSCGRVAINDDPIEHTRSCRARRQNTTESAPETLFLYREIQSEAVRILLPETSFAGTPERVESFKAALELGLEEYFDGSVAHLKTTIQEAPGDEEIARRRYLLIFDRVPGGTGYLADLLRDEEILLEVLEEALEELENCPCVDEEGRDGCYRCIYHYRNHYDMPHTSRSVAQELLGDILDLRDQLVEIDTVDRISVHGVLESELEARFIQSFRTLDREQTRLEKTSVGGKQGYELQIGDYGYDIEPQVHVGPEDGVPRQCKVDFVIWPQEGEMKPIAVFLDGFQYHRNRIGKDLAQRRALRTSDQCWVWSLTWRDVSDESDGLTRNFLHTPNKEFAQLLRAMGDPRAQTSRTVVGKESFDWIVRLLADREPELFERIALAQALLFARAQTPREEWQEAAEANLPSLLADVTAEEAAQEGALLGLEEQPADPVTLWAAAPKSAVQALRDDPVQALQKVAVALHLDDSEERQGEAFETAWNGFLRLYNLLQFLPRAYPVSADEEAFWGYEELIGRRRASGDSFQPGASDGFDEEAWEEVLEYALDDVQRLLELLCEAQMPPPDVPSYELRRNGQIVAEAELGWPNRKVAVLLPGQTAHKDTFEEQGWSVYEAADLNDDPQELVDALSG